MITLTKPHVRVTLAALLSALILTSAGPGPSRADSVSATDNVVVEEVTVPRTLDRTDEPIPLPSSLRKARADTDGVDVVQAEVPLPDGVTLQVGESVQVNYSDGVAVHTALKATCTQTATASTPKLSTANSVYGRHTFSLSTGCTGKVYPEGRIIRVGLLGIWKAAAVRTIQVLPGALASWNVPWTCRNKNATEWLSVTAGEEAGAAIARSDKKKLNCGN